MMERWTNQATLGTQVVAPNRTVEHGQTLQFGDITLKMHFYGTAHTSALTTVPAAWRTNSSRVMRRRSASPSDQSLRVV